MLIFLEGFWTFAGEALIKKEKHIVCRWWRFRKTQIESLRPEAKLASAPVWQIAAATSYVQPHKSGLSAWCSSLKWTC